jgi:OPT oligopeptide transporter protein
MAMTNNAIGLNVITELIAGYALLHRQIAVMMFKAWGYNAMDQALSFTTCLKLGHYMKVPHRPMFFCLLIGTIISSTVQLGVQAWMFSHVEDLCGSNQKDNFICPATNTFGSASIIVGPHSHWSCFSFAYVFPVGCHWTTAYLFSQSPLQ